MLTGPLMSRTQYQNRQCSWNRKVGQEYGVQLWRSRGALQVEDLDFTPSHRLLTYSSLAPNNLELLYTIWRPMGVRSIGPRYSR